MSATVSLLRLLWPFLKEMFLGDKTVMQAIRTNKTRVLLLFLVLGSFAMNLFVLPRTYEISAQYVELERAHKKLKAEGGDITALTAERDQLKKELDEAKATQDLSQTQIAKSKQRENYLSGQVTACQYELDHQPECKMTMSPQSAKSNRYDSFLQQMERWRKEEE